MSWRVGFFLGSFLISRFRAEDTTSGIAHGVMKRGCPTLGLEGWVLLSLSCSPASRINLADQFGYIPRICYRLPFAFGLADQIVIRFVRVDKPDYLDELLKPTTR